MVMGVCDDVTEHSDVWYEHAELFRNDRVHLSEGRIHDWMTGNTGQRDRPCFQHFIRITFKVLPNNCQVSPYRRSYKDVFKRTIMK